MGKKPYKKPELKEFSTIYIRGQISPMGVCADGSNPSSAGCSAGSSPDTPCSPGYALVGECSTGTSATTICYSGGAA